MRNRIDILNDVVSLRGDLSSLEKELSKYPYYAEKAYLVITRTHLLEALKKSLDGKITLRDLVQWTNIIEFRDDLDFENELLQEIVFELSSPEINGEITKKRLQEMIKALSA